MRSQRWLLWVCVPERPLLIITSLEFFVHPDPVGGPQNGATFLQCLLWSKFGGSYSAAQSIKILLNSGSYLQNVSPEHSSSSCAISYLLRISGNSSNLTWISWSFRSFASKFGMRVWAGLVTTHRLIQHIPPDVVLTTSAYLWPVNMAIVEMAVDTVLKKQTECGVLFQEFWDEVTVARCKNKQVQALYSVHRCRPTTGIWSQIYAQDRPTNFCCTHVLFLIFSITQRIHKPHAIHGPP